MHVVLIAVISLDGRITRPNESGPGFASEEDQLWFHTALQQFDCSVMGRATYLTVREQLAGEASTSKLRVIMTRTPEAHAGDAVPNHIEFTSADPQQIVADLRTRQRRRCALLGGGQIYRLFLNAGLVDAMWLTIEPCVLGGGTPLADGLVHDGRFHLEEMRLLSPTTLLLNYRRPGAPPIRVPFP